MQQGDQDKMKGDARDDSSVSEQLHNFVADRADDPLVRIAIPYLSAQFRAGVGAAPLSGGGSAAVNGLRLLEVAKARTGLRSPFFVSGGATAAVSTANQARALERVWKRLGGSPQRARARPSWKPLWRASSRALVLADELRAAIADFRPDARVDRIEVAHAFLFGAAMHSLAAAQLTAVLPRVALVTSSHGLATRALALLAREAGIPSVYVPHAPVIRATELADLPVDYAAVRGPAEIDYYETLGVDRALLTATGDPSIDVAEKPPALDPGLPCVFAPSPISVARLRALVDRIADATSEPIVVSPHPRQRATELRSLIPAHWTIAEGRTYDRLRAGHPVLLQHSSGVALESLQLGIPTVELTLAEHPTHYPFIAEPHIPLASSPEQLAHEIGRGRAIAADAAGRMRLREWAGRWVASTGNEAAERIHQVIARARQEGPRDRPIWDAWLPPAPGRETVGGRSA